MIHTGCASRHPPAAASQTLFPDGRRLSCNWGPLARRCQERTRSELMVGLARSLVHSSRPGSAPCNRGTRRVTTSGVCCPAPRAPLPGWAPGGSSLGTTRRGRIRAQPSGCSTVARWTFLVLCRPFGLRGASSPHVAGGRSATRRCRLPHRLAESDRPSHLAEASRTSGGVSRHRVSRRSAQPRACQEYFDRWR